MFVPRVEFLASCLAAERERERERVTACVRERQVRALLAGFCWCVVSFHTLRIGVSLLNIAALLLLPWLLPHATAVISRRALQAPLYQPAVQFA